MLFKQNLGLRKGNWKLQFVFQGFGFRATWCGQRGGAGERGRNRGLSVWGSRVWGLGF